MAVKPSSSGFCPTYSNPAEARTLCGNRTDVVDTSQIRRGASGTSCPVRRSRALARANVAFTDPNEKWRCTDAVNDRTNDGPTFSCSPVSGSSLASSCELLTLANVTLNCVLLNDSVITVW